MLLITIKYRNVLIVFITHKIVDLSQFTEYETEKRIQLEELKCTIYFSTLLWMKYIHIDKIKIRNISINFAK